MNYFVGGVNGTGKTTLLSTIQERCPNFLIVKSSAHLFDALGIAPGNYEKLRSLSSEFKNQTFSELMHQITDTADNTTESLIVEGHFLNFDNAKITDVTGDWLTKFDALVLLRSTSDDILRRINRDHHRAGRYDFVNVSQTSEQVFKIMIDGYSAETDKQAAILATKYGKPLFVIHNRDGALDKSVEEFLNFHVYLSRAFEKE